MILNTVVDLGLISRLATVGSYIIYLFAKFLIIFILGMLSLLA
jgi:hypothetical protein